MSKTRRVTIEIYDEAGTLCESIGGPMDFEKIKSNMLDALKNDGIPVLIVHGKHEKDKSKQVIRAALQGNIHPSNDGGMSMNGALRRCESPQKKRNDKA